jgi:biotin synthase
MNILNLTQEILNGHNLSKKEAIEFLELDKDHLHEILYIGSTLRNYFRKEITTCTITNAKNGKCSEDCAYCAQSVHHDVDVKCYELRNTQNIVEDAQINSKYGQFFSIVCSGRSPLKDETSQICKTVRSLNEKIPELSICASLGIMSVEELKELKNAGLKRYHHNLESSKNYFDKMCTTHTWQERVETVRNAKEAGLQTCVGGPFGLGETLEDRADLLFEVKELDPDAVPLNFLVPVKGTKLEKNNPVSMFEAVKIVALARIIMPTKDIKVCGGRLEVFKDSQALVFLSGASSIMTGNLLTVKGRKPEEDAELISMLSIHNRE